MSGFAVMGNKGFHITFTNDVTVSVQFGAANYCEHYSARIGSERECDRWESTDAEVAVWQQVGRDTRWITGKYTGQGKDDDVLSRRSPEDVLKILNWAAAYKAEEVPA